MAIEVQDRIVDLQQFQQSDGYRQIYPGYSNKYVSVPDDKLLCKVCVVTNENQSTGHLHTTSDSIHIILEGEGEILTDKGPIPVKAGQLTYTKAEHLHGFRSTTDKPMWFLSIEGPVPLDLLSAEGEHRGWLDASGQPISK